jgi:hypothetical protein
VQDSEIVEVIQGDENVIETILNFISRADTGIDAFVYQSRPAANMNNVQITASRQVDLPPVSLPSGDDWKHFDPSME